MHESPERARRVERQRPDSQRWDNRAAKRSDRPSSAGAGMVLATRALAGVNPFVPGFPATTNAQTA